MADARIEALAETVVAYSLDVQPGQLVAITGEPVAEPLIRAAYLRVLARGAHPMVLLAPPGLRPAFLRLASDEQLQYVSPVERLVPEQVDAVLSILSETNTRDLAGVSAERQQTFRRARTDLQQRYLERAAQGQLAWCLTLFPTEAYAQDAEMSLEEYEEFVFGAGLLGAADPADAWRTQSADQQRMVDWLADKRDAYVLGPDTELHLSVAGRTFINADGRHNFPDGEIFTGPVEDSVEGHVRFSFPSTVGGRKVEDVQLWFEGGRVVRATAAAGEDFLLAALDTDQGARRLGEFAFGTNRGITRYTGNTLFDEKIGGTMHLAIGAGYPQTGARNQSALHWDMVCDLRRQSEVRFDGQLFMENGRIVI
ncbi:MAG TPA: aminopeptidase [Thermomicrobiaceae bacterium]|nr:aminopeptidase [Thermomicrobiaceae bacterium]